MKNSLCGKKTCTMCGFENCIRSIPLLSNLSVEQAREISEGVQSKNVKRGEFLFRQGQKADRLYIICSGKVKLLKPQMDGKEQILYILSEGDFFGAFNLLKEDRLQYDAIVLEDTQVTTLEKNEFDKIILLDPTITLKVFEKAYERIKKVENLVARLSTSSLDAKVAGLLLTLVEGFGTQVPEGILLSLSINREEMGSYAGIARETMSRKLKLFEEMGYISFIGTKKIVIRELKALEMLLEDA